MTIYTKFSKPSTATIIERLRDLQPLLCRVVSKWMSIPADIFSPFLPDGQQRIWRLAVENCVVLKTLDASGFPEVKQTWVSLVFVLQQPTERKCLARVSQELAHLMFPDYQEMGFNSLVSPTMYHESSKNETGVKQHHIKTHIKFERAIKQIEAIAIAVSKGHDDKAHRYLEDLVNTQTANNRDVLPTR